MNERHLHDLLELATENLPTRDRARRAMERTVKVRRRRAAVGLAGGLSAFVLAAVAISNFTGTERPAPNPPPATTSPDASTSSAPVEDVDLTAPPIDPRVIQDEWDPAAALSTQDVRSLPPSLVPPVDMPELTGMPRASAVVLTDSGLAAVDLAGGGGSNSACLRRRSPTASIPWRCRWMARQCLGPDAPLSGPATYAVGRGARSPTPTG